MGELKAWKEELLVAAGPRLNIALAYPLLLSTPLPPLDNLSRVIGKVAWEM